MAQGPSRPNRESWCVGPLPPFATGIAAAFSALWPSAFRLAA